MVDHRVERGRATQEMLAARLRGLGLVYAASRPASLAGEDITGVPGMYIEVKAKERAEPLRWTRENAAKAGRALPFVVWRARGQGPATLGEWVVMTRWADHEQLLGEAGYLPDASGWESTAG
jgi:hypothetical protein